MTPFSMAITGPVLSGGVTFLGGDGEGEIIGAEIRDFVTNE